MVFKVLLMPKISEKIAFYLLTEGYSPLALPRLSYASHKYFLHSELPWLFRKMIPKFPGCSLTKGTASAGRTLVGIRIKNHAFDDHTHFTASMLTA